MATSARTPSTRQKKTGSDTGMSPSSEGAAKNGAGSGAKRKSGASGKGGTVRRTTSSAAGTRTRGGSSRARRANPSRPVTKGPFELFWQGIAVAISLVWMGVARSAGHLFRRAGSGARNLHPDHRRDGIGLGLLAAALIVGAAVWHQLPGKVGGALITVITGGVGVLDKLVPLVPLGLAGLVHIARGAPTPSMGARAMRHGGGWLGYIVSAPISAVLSQWLAVPLLLIVVAFGLLVTTATPVYRIPDRLRTLRFKSDAMLYRILRGTPPPDQMPTVVEDDPTDLPVPQRQPRRRKPGPVDPALDPANGLPLGDPVPGLDPDADPGEAEPTVVLPFPTQERKPSRGGSPAPAKAGSS